MKTIWADAGDRGRHDQMDYAAINAARIATMRWWAS